MTIAEITNKYKGKLDYLDREILIAHSLGKTREFVLTYPDQAITKIQETKIKKNIARRLTGEPVAYILGHKEFYGLNFIVNKHTLVPRPETELMIEEVLQLLRSTLRSSITVIDIGTGSGCIITSIAHESKTETNFYAMDISKDALTVAKKNAKQNGVDKKIKFLHGNLLEPFLKTKNSKSGRLIITANLPYLSREIYNGAPVDVKKFEPKSALYSAEAGLAHYRELLSQIKQLHADKDKLSIICYFEISPEQKTSLTKLIRSIFRNAKIEFKKDLANKWRICKININ
jgi:release factor glutamine methyltransferase